MQPRCCGYSFITCGFMHLDTFQRRRQIELREDVQFFHSVMVKAHSYSF